MTRYFFDIHDGKQHRDDVGVECSTLSEMQREARRSLPEIARDLLPTDGEQHILKVNVRDPHNQIIYTASLTYIEQALGLNAASQTNP